MGEAAGNLTAAHTIKTPHTIEEIVRIVGEARAARTPVSIVGGGSHTAYARPMQTGMSLSLEKLTGVTLYEPKELVLSARAGTPLVEIERLLAENNQTFAFEPPHFSRLFGHQTERANIGGVIATGRSGPRRVLSGAARDALIGVNFVNGKGEFIRAGGRVMKNVTGYDLTKLQTGAHGSLGILTDVTFKLIPKPEAQATLVFSGLDYERGVKAMSAGLGCSFEVSAAAMVPRDGDMLTLMRLEGFEKPLQGRVDNLVALLKEVGTPEILRQSESEALWASVRDVASYVPDEAALWRVSTVPSAAATLLKQVEPVLVAKPLIDWGGGLLWLPVMDAGDARAAQIRAALPKRAGHATLYRASAATRLAASPFHPLSVAQANLNSKIKEAFDPDRILNPNVMYEGI